MGLFNFFKKQASSTKVREEMVEVNNMILDELKRSIEALGHTVVKSSTVLALKVDSDIEIATVILEHPNADPRVIELATAAIHYEYFPTGIKDNLVGAGMTLEEKLTSIVESYMFTTFPAIMSSLSDTHNPELDFYSQVNGKEILWHPCVGALGSNGRWIDKPADSPLLYNLVKDKLKDIMPNNKINWLKLFTAKMPDGTIVADCHFNNEVWEDGMKEIGLYAAENFEDGSYQGMKQFVTIRRCNKYDN